MTSDSTSAGPAVPATGGGGPSGLLIVAVMGIGMLLGILFLAWLGTPRVEPTVGQKIDKLDLAPLAFADGPLSEKDLPGKITVLHFWGTWCPPCLSEFPEFVKVAQSFEGNDGVQFISVSSSKGPEYDLEGLAQATKSFLERFQATIPTYADPAGLSRVQVAMLLPDGSLPYPCTFVLDRQGVVVGVWRGFTPDGMQEVAQKVHSLLGATRSDNAGNKPRPVKIVCVAKASVSALGIALRLALPVLN